MPKHVKADRKREFTVEQHGDSATIHFMPDIPYMGARGSRLLRAFATLGLLGGCLPGIMAAGMTDEATNSGEAAGLAFFAVWAACFFLPLVFQGRLGSDRSKWVVHLWSDRIQVADEMQHVYDREGIGDVYSLTPAVRWKSPAGARAARLRQQENQAVMASYGSRPEVIIIDYALNRDQAEGIRDLVAQWRDDPASVIVGLQSGNQVTAA